jgi:lysophospholipase L1-like esterase
MKKQTALLAVVIAIVFLVSPLAVFELTDSQSAAPKAPAHSCPIRVACVGDSITANSGYPSDLQALLGANYTVGNFGSSGSTVSLNSWKPYMNQTEFQNAEDFQPDIVIIMLGTNDDLMGLHQYNESFEDDYGKLITSFQQTQNNPEVLIAESPPIFSNSTDLSPAYLTSIIIPKTQDLANRLNLPLVDVYSAFDNQSDCFVDGVHPDSQGASIIASEVYYSMDSIYGLNQTS